MSTATAETTRTCQTCQQDKPASAYYSRQKSCKGCVIVRARNWVKANPERRKANMDARHEHDLERKRAYRRENRDRIKAQWRERMSTPDGRWWAYKAGARTREITFTLTLDEFKMFWQKPCWYCGDDIKTIGLDRVNNEQGYVMGNVLPCCEPCNRAKLNATKDEYIERCRRVAALHREL